MPAASFIALQSIPIATAIVFGSDQDDPWANLFLIVYIAVLGLLLSAVFMISGDLFGGAQLDPAFFDLDG